MLFFTFAFYSELWIVGSSWLSEKTYLNLVDSLAHGEY